MNNKLRFFCSPIKRWYRLTNPSSIRPYTTEGSTLAFCLKDVFLNYLIRDLYQRCQYVRRIKDVFLMGFALRGISVVLNIHWSNDSRHDPRERKSYFKGRGTVPYGTL